MKQSNNQTIKQLKKGEGFTLIELLVALTVFTLAILAATSVFVMTLRGQRQVLAMQEVQDNARYILDSMAKEIRMMLWVEQISEDGTMLMLLHPRNYYITYEFLNGNIMREGQQINSSAVEVEGGFNLLGGRDYQYRANIFMKLKSKKLEQGDQPEMILQATVSQRNFTTREGFLY